MRLRDKKAIVTGAGSGIGRATARRFAAEGAIVAAADLNEAAARETVRLIEESGGRAVAVLGDVADKESCAEMIDTAERELGGLDIMFNNAGIVLPDDAGPEDTPVATWNTTLAVNLTGVFLCCKYGIPALRRSGGGSVVNNASLVVMTREMAVMYARHRIRFNAVCPGPVGTELTTAFFDSEEKWLSRRRYMPMGRLGTPDEIANLVLFLASDESSYVNGAAYMVDGGISAAYVIKDEEAPS